MSRGPDEIHHEAQYWSLALDDIREVSDAIARVAGELIETPLALLQLAVLERDTNNAETVMEAVNRVLRELRGIQPHLMNVADLARGRYGVLQREVDELDDDDDQRRKP